MSKSAPDENRNVQIQTEYGPLKLNKKGISEIQFLNTPKLGQEEAPRPMAHPLTELHVNRLDFSKQTNVPKPRQRAPSLNFDVVKHPVAKFDYSSLVERRSSMASLSSTANQVEHTEPPQIQNMRCEIHSVPKQPEDVQIVRKNKQQLKKVDQSHRSLSVTNRYIKNAQERQRSIARLQMPVLMQKRVGMVGKTGVTGRQSHLSSARSSRHNYELSAITLGSDIDKSRNPAERNSNLFEQTQPLTFSLNTQDREQITMEARRNQPTIKHQRATSEHLKLKIMSPHDSKFIHPRTSAVLQNPLTIDSLENNSEPPTGRFVNTRRQQSLHSMQSAEQATTPTNQLKSEQEYVKPDFQVDEVPSTDDQQSDLEMDDQIENTLKYTDINSLLFSPPGAGITFAADPKVQQQRQERRKRQQTSARQKQKQRPISLPMMCPAKKQNLLTLPRIKHQFSPMSLEATTQELQPYIRNQKGFSFSTRPFTTLASFQKNRRTFKNIISTSPNLIKGLLSPQTPQLQPSKALSQKGEPAAPQVSYIRHTASSRSRAASTRAATLQNHIQKLKLYLFNGVHSKGPLSTKSGQSKPSERESVSPILISNRPGTTKSNSRNGSVNVTSASTQMKKSKNMKHTMSNIQSSGSNCLPLLGGTSPHSVSQFDPQLNIKSKSVMQNMQKLRKAARLVAKKIETYRAQFTIEAIRAFSHISLQPTTAHFKAGRCLCLLMKSFTAIDEENRQVKDDEIFKTWDKVCQYLNSDQGADQVDQFKDIVAFSESPESRQLIDKETLLRVLRREIFGYTLHEQSQSAADEPPCQKALNGFDLQSPRVKNEHVKCYFSLAYFVMVFVAIHEAIEELELHEKSLLIPDENQTQDNTTITNLELRRSQNTTDESMFQNMNDSVSTKHNKSTRLPMNLNKYQSLNSSTCSGKMPLDSEREDKTSVPGHVRGRSLQANQFMSVREEERTSSRVKSGTAKGGGQQNTIDSTQAAIQCATCDMFSSQVKMDDEVAGSSSEFKSGQQQQINMVLGSNRDIVREQGSQPQQVSAGLDLSDVYDEAFNQRDLAQRNKIIQNQFKGIENIEISELDLGIAEAKKNLNLRYETIPQDEEPMCLTQVPSAQPVAEQQEDMDMLEPAALRRLTLNEAASAAHIAPMQIQLELQSSEEASNQIKADNSLVMQRSEAITTIEQNEAAGISHNRFTDSIMTVASNLQSQHEAQESIQEEVNPPESTSALQFIQFIAVGDGLMKKDGDLEIVISSASEFTFDQKQDEIGSGLAPNPLGGKSRNFEQIETPSETINSMTGTRSFQTSPHRKPNQEATTLLVQTINSCAKKGEQVRVEDLLRKINKEERLCASQTNAEHFENGAILYESLASQSCLSNALQKKRASLEKAFMEFYKEGQESPTKISTIDGQTPSGRQQFTNTIDQATCQEVEVINLYDVEPASVILKNQNSQRSGSDCGTPMQQKFVSPENIEASPITQILMRRLPQQYSNQDPMIISNYQSAKALTTEESEPHIVFNQSETIGDGLLDCDDLPQPAENNSLLGLQTPLHQSDNGLLIDKLKQQRSVSTERKTGTELNSEVERILAEARRLTAPADQSWNKFIQGNAIYSFNQ